MDYREFVETVKIQLEEKLGEEYTVHVNTVLKNNQKPLDTLAILKRGENASPTIYMELFYRKYVSGTEMSGIVQMILDYYFRNKVVCNINAEYILNFENVREHVVCRLVNCEKNRCMLEQIPHRHFLDLVLIFYFNVDHAYLGRGSVRIQNAHLEMWGITEEELYRCARKNTAERTGHELIGVAELIEDMMGMRIETDPDDYLPMYVLTNKERCYGAVNITFPDVLKSVAVELEDDFYILPSSVHECMILPVHSGCGMSERELREMVCEINQAHVETEEVLGDSVYRYFSEKGELRVVADARAEMLRGN